MKKENSLFIVGAETHNLKKVDLTLPLNKLVCINGPSGSGKSSLAFHTIFQEAKRRYINSLPSSQKFFFETPGNSEVESLHPVPPVWALEQRNPIRGTKTTVADVMGATEMIQKIFFSLGKWRCPEHQCLLEKRMLGSDFEKVRHALGEESVLYAFVSSHCYLEKYPNTLPVRSLGADNKIHTCREEDEYYELFRLKGKKAHLLEKKILSTGIELHEIFLWVDGNKYNLNSDNSLCCEKCNFTVDLALRNFYDLSPYNAYSACSICSGHGSVLVFDREKLVKFPSRSINEGAISVLTYKTFSYYDKILKKELKKRGFDLKKPFDQLPKKIWKILYEGVGDYPGFNDFFLYLESKRYKKNIRILTRSLQKEEVCLRCYGTKVNSAFSSLFINPGTSLKISYQEFLQLELRKQKKVIDKLLKSTKENSVSNLLRSYNELLNLSEELNIGYLTTMTKAKELDVSEYQRLLLLKYLSHRGTGGLFILDEPTVGLTISEIKTLVKKLKFLAKRGNSILVVDHSDYLERSCDYLIQMGPGAGHEGGRVVFQGLPPKRKAKKITSKKTNDSKKSLSFQVGQFKEKILMAGINHVQPEMCYRPAKEVSRQLVGKAYSFFNDDLKFNYQDCTLNERVLRQYISDVSIFVPSHSGISGRSTVGSFLGITPYLRKYFASLSISKSLGLVEGHFSPNTELGKCPSCEGKGKKIIDMSFMEDLELSCEDCQGLKLRPYISSLTDGHMTVGQYYQSPLSHSLNNIKLTPKLMRIFNYLKMLNLEYLSIDRKLNTLSGGEFQRIKLVSFLDKEPRQCLLYFEDISQGLSAKELDGLSKLFDFITSLDNTILILDTCEQVSSLSHHCLKI